LPQKEKRWHAKEAWPKKREREKRGSHVSKKRDRMIQKRKAITSMSKPYPSIHPSTHTHAPFDQDCMTCFSMDPLLGFTIYRIQVWPVLSYIELHKGL
jgi:hypothetical protein